MQSFIPVKPEIQHSQIVSMISFRMHCVYAVIRPLLPELGADLIFAGFWTDKWAVMTGHGSS